MRETGAILAQGVPIPGQPGMILARTATPGAAVHRQRTTTGMAIRTEIARITDLPITMTEAGAGIGPQLGRDGTDRP